MNTGLNTPLKDRGQSGLVRALTSFDVFVISVSAPTGSGILWLSVKTSGPAGGSISLAFLLGALLFLPLVVNSLILASNMRRSGGPYVAISRFVHPGLGYLAAMLLIWADALLIGVVGFLVMLIAGGLLSGIAQAHNLPQVAEFAAMLSSTQGKIIGGTLWVLLFWVFMLQRPKVFKAVVRSLFVLTYLVAIGTAVLFFTSSNGSAIAGFNQLWGEQASAQIIQLAQSNGWVATPFSWSATLPLILVVVWAFNGVDLASYAAGEIRSPVKSYWRGMMWGWLAVAFVYIMLAMSVHSAFGQLIPAYDFVYKLGLENTSVDRLLSNPVEPSIPFYLTALVRHPVLALGLGISFVLWFAQIIPAIYLSISRLMYALAVNRLLPIGLVKLDSKRSVPRRTVHVTMLLGLGGVALQSLDVNALLGVIMFCTQFIVWLTGIAVIRLPKTLGEALAPSWLANRFLGLRVTTWFGSLNVLVGFFLLYLTLNSAASVPGAVLYLLFMVTVLVASYYLRMRYLARHDSAFAEIEA